MLESLEKNDDTFKELSVDAEKLEYLSSAGIRVLMMAAKKFEKVTVHHTSDAIKEIFAGSDCDHQISVD